MNGNKEDLKKASSLDLRIRNIVVLSLLFILMLAGIIFIMGEKDDHGKQKRSFAEFYLPSSEMSYFKDERTDLCFAYFVDQRMGTDHISVTNVPCDKVEKFLIPFSPKEGSNQDIGKKKEEQ